MRKVEEPITLRREHGTHDAGRQASPAESETTTGGSLESPEVDEKPHKKLSQRLKGTMEKSLTRKQLDLPLSASTRERSPCLLVLQEIPLRPLLGLLRTAIFQPRTPLFLPTPPSVSSLPRSPSYRHPSIHQVSERHLVSGLVHGGRQAQVTHFWNPNSRAIGNPHRRFCDSFPLDEGHWEWGSWASGREGQCCVG